MRSAWKVLAFRLWFDAAAGDGGGQSAGTGAAAPEGLEAPEKAQAAEQAGKGPQGGQETAEEAKQPTAEERAAEWRRLISGEYRDLYEQDLRRQTDLRFSQAKQNAREAEELRGLAGLLGARYNVAEGDLTALRRAVENDRDWLERAAYNAGMSVEQYQERTRLEAENRQLRAEKKAMEDQEARRVSDMRARMMVDQWFRQADEAKMAEKYPGFNLAEETKNPEFLSMLRRNVPVEVAYRRLHVDELERAAAGNAAAAAEKRVTDNIKARGNRPPAAGSGSGAGFTAKLDVNTMTREERLKLLERAAGGEVIRFTD